MPTRQVTAAPVPITRRGDQEGRRRDILAAAAELLAERSWDGFTMRDVATRAGLSAGAVYQYFDGKRHIFTALYEERLRGQLEQIESVPSTITLRELVGQLLRGFAEIYTRFGRHHFAWTAEGLQRSDATVELSQTFHRLADSVERSLRSAAEREGRALRPGAGLLPYLWATCNGVGDQLLDARYRVHGATADDFLELTADALVDGLTQPCGR